MLLLNLKLQNLIKDDSYKDLNISVVVLKKIFICIYKFVELVDEYGDI